MSKRTQKRELVKRIIEAHDGAITFESEKEKRTTFVSSLKS